LSDLIKVLVVSSSLSEESRSKTLCEHAHNFLTSKKIDAKHESLQDYRVLPYGMDGSEGLDKLGDAFGEADAILLGFPVYNYNMNASLKAVIEHFGGSMRDKVIGLMMSAGGQASYMSGLVVANSLMLDFRSWVVPRFVYATGEAFGEDAVTDPEIASRIEDLAWTVYEKAWQHRQTPPPS
jgi:NAD(P)H-dependent FMN reductase